MPIISQFYGIIVAMYFNENNGKHYIPHIHIRYNEYKSVYDLSANKLEGEIPRKQAKMVEAWILIHKEELESLWKLCQEENEIFRIEPLK